MEEKVNRLKQKIADLQHLLEQLALDRIEVNADQGEHMMSSPEHALHGLRLLALDIREEELSARLRAAEISLARLEVEAGLEWIRKLQPCPSVRDLERYRAEFTEVLKQHKEDAEQQIAAAVDVGLAVERSNEGITRAPLPEHRTRRHRPDLGYDGPEHGYDGPSLGR